MSGSVVYLPTKKMTKVTLTSSGNFTVPDGVTTLFVDAWGGGGSGANTGGAGGLSFSGKIGGRNFTILSVTPNQIIPYTIGVGGASVLGSNPGNNGGDTDFGTEISAPGGAGGWRLNATAISGDFPTTGTNGFVPGVNGGLSGPSSEGTNAALPGGIASGGFASTGGPSGAGGNGIIYVYYNNPNS